MGSLDDTIEPCAQKRSVLSAMVGIGGREKEEAHSKGPAQAHAQIPPSRESHVIMEKQHGQTMSSSDLETSGKKARKRAPAGKNPPVPLVEPSVAMDTTCAGVRE